MKKDILYLVCIKVRRGFEGILRDDLAYRYNMHVEEAIEIMNWFNSQPNRHPGYRYVIQKQRTRYEKHLDRVYNGLTADPIKKYSDQFCPPYTGPIIHK